VRLCTGILLATAAAPAAAERVETLWRLEPVSGTAAGTVRRGEPFLVERLLPVKLVKLSESMTVGKTVLPAGTPLYLVFNSAGRIAYCTVKDRSTGHQAKTLFIPILDQRPCFVDSDGDSRFDKSFSVYDKGGPGPPTVAGSIDGAAPFAGGARFEPTDPHEFPTEMHMSFQFTGSKTDVGKARIRFEFNDWIGGNWTEVDGQRTSEGALFDLGNAQVLLRSVAETTADFELRVEPDFYISTTGYNRVVVGRLPAYVQTS
jgi:hypothetical protein